MATSATGMLVKTPFVINEPNSETEEEQAGDNINITKSESDNNADLLIKLEPEDDSEYADYQQICSVQQIPASSKISDRNDDRTNALPGQHFQQSDDSENESSTTKFNHLAKVREEENSHASSGAVFPVRMYRSENVTSTYTAGKDSSLSTLGDSAVLDNLNDDETGDSRSSEDSSKMGVTVSRRKVSSMSALLPQNLQAKKRKMHHTGSSQSQKVAPVSGAVKEEEGDAAESSHDPHVTFPETVRSARRRGHKRNPTLQLFTCSECGTTFRWPSRYRDHLRTHSGERPFTCADCGASFSSASYLRIHARKHSGLLPYPCALCHQAFPAAKTLALHRRTHAERGAFSCGECGRKCRNSGELSTHVQREHPQSASAKPFTCPLCPAAFGRSYHLQTHMRRHTGEKPFKCTQCHLAYTTEGSLKVHMRTHTGERPFPCTQCDRAFVTSSQLKKHHRSHNKPIVTVSPDGNTVYTQRLTTSDRGRGPNQESGEEEEEGAKLEIECFAKDSVYNCDVCQEVFVRSMDLATHSRTAHPHGALPAAENMCRECGAVFTRRHSLKIHMRIHSGFRPFDCEICGKKFTQRGNLYYHLRTGHCRGQSLRCSVCGEGFSSVGGRQVHMRTHGEVRPCACVVCGWTFSSHALLASHVQSHGRSEVAAAFKASAAAAASGKSPETKLKSNGDEDCVGSSVEETEETQDQRHIEIRGTGSGEHLSQSKGIVSAERALTGRVT